MEILDKNLDVKLGQLIRVKNLNKKKFENDLYVSLQVEDENGDNERCILFSEKEILKMKNVESKFLLDNFVAGRIYKFSVNDKDINLIKIIDSEGELKIIKMSNSKLEMAEIRANKNKEDLTKKGFLTNLFD